MLDLVYASWSAGPKMPWSEAEALLGIVDDTEEKSQKDQVLTASKPSK